MFMIKNDKSCDHGGTTYLKFVSFISLLYRGIILPSIRERYYNRQDSVAGCCFPRIFGRCSSFGNCKVRPMEQTQMQAGNMKRLASSSPEKDNKKLRTPCAKLALNLQWRTSWSAYGVRVSNSGNVQR